MNDLARHLASQIRLHGPLTIAAYMAAALGHPKWGYYISRDPLGRAGDFVTAPEVSQMFGELIGLWCRDRWQAIGAPERFILAELGPGRGTLMADALRAAGAQPAFGAAAELHLVEISPVLRAAQEKALIGRKVTWHERIEELPQGPGPALVIANEFFDALPIHQFQRTAKGWHERMVGVADDTLHVVLNPAANPSALNFATPLDGIVEVSPARNAAVSALAQYIMHRGGAALIIDYGHGTSAPGDTLQAMRAHKYVDPFLNPGEADLTSHVDFQALGAAAHGAGAATHGPVSQGSFLNHLGISVRAERLCRRATESQTQDIASALHRLTAQDQMGQLFKVMAITPRDGSAPPGFEET